MDVRADRISDDDDDNEKVSNKHGRPRLCREVVVGAVAAYLLGEPLKLIAARFGISMTAVVNRAAKAGFKPRKKRRRSAPQQPSTGGIEV